VIVAGLVVLLAAVPLAFFAGDGRIGAGLACCVAAFALWRAAALQERERRHRSRPGDAATVLRGLSEWLVRRRKAPIVSEEARERGVEYATGVQDGAYAMLDDVIDQVAEAMRLLPPADRPGGHARPRGGSAGAVATGPPRGSGGHRASHRAGAPPTPARRREAQPRPEAEPPRGRQRREAPTPPPGPGWSGRPPTAPPGSRPRPGQPPPTPPGQASPVAPPPPGAPPPGIQSPGPGSSSPQSPGSPPSGTRPPEHPGRGSSDPPGRSRSSPPADSEPEEQPYRPARRPQRPPGSTGPTDRPREPSGPAHPASPQRPTDAAHPPDTGRPGAVSLDRASDRIPRASGMIRVH
jgi:hypothetical protein